MESPSRALILSSSPPPPPSLPRPDYGNAPEFEFWNSARNNTEPVHSADELFFEGFLLPLHSLSITRSEPDLEHDIGSVSVEVVEPGLAEPSAHITSVATSNSGSVLSASKRWIEIFKRSEKKAAVVDDKAGLCEESSSSKCEKVVDNKRREKNRRNRTGSGSGSAELNINLWPFSRSRSAGSGNKPEKTGRKTSSAPCSRSNSSGESRLSPRRSWPGSPARPGLHLARPGPVWQAKRAVPGSRPSSGPAGGKADVPRRSVRCGGDESGVVAVGGQGGKSGGGNGKLFGFRGLFGKKSNSGTVLTV